MKILYIVFLSLVFSDATLAQLPYRLDSTYGTNGISVPLLTLEGGYTVFMHQLGGSAIQKDDKLVAVAMNNVNGAAELLRFKTNGTFDSSFNSVGYVLNSTPGIGPANTYSYAIQGMGLDTFGNSICLYNVNYFGTLYASVQSYKPNGTLNTGFGSGGTDSIQNYPPEAMNINQKTNRIYVGGYFITPPSWVSAYVVISLNGNGSRNTSFGTAGVVRCSDARLLSRNNQVTAVKAMDDGRVYIAGEMINSGVPDSFFVGRLKSNGTADSTFGVNGFILHAPMGSAIGVTVPGDIHTDSLGQLYVVTSTGFSSNDTNHIAILKLDSVGNPVSSFGVGGYEIVSETFGPFYPVYGQRRTISYLQRDGKLIIAGTSDTSAASAFKILRITTDGNYDTTFCAGGIMSVSNGHRDKCTGLQMQSDGKLVLSGYQSVPTGGYSTSMPMLVRLTNKPKADTTASVAALPYQGLHLSAYPNPSTNGSFTIGCSGLREPIPARLLLHDVTGRLLASSTAILQAGDNTFGYHIPAGAAPGLYYLNVCDGSTVISTIELVSY